MSHYKRNADANRDALFGPSSSSSTSKPTATRSAPSSSKPAGTTSTTTRNANSGVGLGGASADGFGHRSAVTGSARVTGVLSGAAKLEKMKEAEKYRDKAKGALQRTMFSRPDPIAGGMFYHKAAEAYKTCGENRLERLHRIASADCQMGHGAHATAAAEFTRAAELAEQSGETDARRRAECRKLFGDAAKAWEEVGERGRVGECRLKGAFAGLLGVEDGDLVGMERDVVVGVEEAVEGFVPDPLNRYRQFRKTGVSAYVDPEAEAAAATAGGVDPDVEEENLALCRSHLVTSSYSHETLLAAAYKLASYSEYASALYTLGAVSAILEHDDFATISLSRAYVAETILTLALGDVVAADNFFMQVHLQRNSYLESRECKLAEDLIRAVKERDVDELDEARGAEGGNRAAMGNLDMVMRGVVKGLRITGAAKKKKKSTAAVGKTTAPVVDGVSKNPNLNGSDLQVDMEANFAEMDDIMNSMGLGDNDDDAAAAAAAADDDDEFDLR